MKRSVVFFMLIGLVSCKYFYVEKTTSRAIVEGELKTINWKDVDVYPSFAICDSVNGKYEKKNCFQYRLKKQILDALEKEIITVSKDVNDTVNLKFHLSEKGKLSLHELKMDSVTLEEIPNLEFIIEKSLDSLPEIYPAIKRMMQVKTEFSLPIVINVN